MISKKISDPIIPLGLGLAALIIGMGVLFFTFDPVGDASHRAIGAYNWSRTPYFSRCGDWLPAPLYLNGLFYFVLDDPLISTRVFNLIVGSLTVPLFYYLITEVFNRTVALVSATILLFLPLRVGLAASSLTESGFGFEMVGGMFFLILSTKSEKQSNLYLGVSLILLTLAEMTRYEAWVLLPIFPIYYFFRTKRLAASVSILILLAAFPIAWTIGNYQCFGDPWKGFRAATTAERMATAVTFLQGLGLISNVTVRQAGLILPVCVIVGVAWLAVTLVWRRTITANILLYVASASTVWAMTLKFAMARGPNAFWTRYIFFAFVLAIPFGVLPFSGLISRNRTALFLTLAVFVTSLLAAGNTIYKTSLPDIWVTKEEPPDQRKVALWLRTSPYAQDAILSTPISIQSGWAAHYFTRLYPEASSRFELMSFWLTDEYIMSWVKERQPSLLINGNSDHDREEKARLERLLGKSIDENRLVFESGSIKVYRIRDPSE